MSASALDALQASKPASKQEREGGREGAGKPSTQRDPYSDSDTEYE